MRGESLTIWEIIGSGVVVAAMMLVAKAGRAPCDRPHVLAAKWSCTHRVPLIRVPVHFVDAPLTAFDRAIARAPYNVA